MFLVATFVFFCAISTALGNDQENTNAVKVNIGALEYAKELIKQGRIVADGRGAWGEHRPSAVAENEFIHLHGFGEYAKWHLGIDDRYAESREYETKIQISLRRFQKCSSMRRACCAEQGRPT